MIGTDLTTTGAAGAAPKPGVGMRASLRTGAVLVAPTAVPSHGTGPARTGFTSAVRPWAPVLSGVRFTGPDVRDGGTAVQSTTDILGEAARAAGYAERTASSTPGALPPRDPLS